jgi:CBS domain-containing protein
MSSRVSQIIARKPDIYSTTPEATVLEALRLMAEKNVGALLVMSGGQIQGIFSERDYARKVVLYGKASSNTPVSEIMTTDVVCVEPNWTPEQCMALMTENRIRHLAVTDNGRLVGVISIGDVVAAVVAEQQFAIRSLEHYITSP